MKVVADLSGVPIEFGVSVANRAPPGPADSQACGLEGGARNKLPATAQELAWIFHKGLTTTGVRLFV